MKLKSIEIANFKAFGKEFQTIPIKPITLVFGPNSAGKSSLIHSLLWLNHATTRGETDIFHPALSGESVNLGGFKHCLNQKSGKQRLKIALTIKNEADATDSEKWKIKANNFRLDLSYGRVQQSKPPTLVRFSLHADQQVLLNVENLHGEAKIDWRHPSLSGILPQRGVEEYTNSVEYCPHFNGLMPHRIELEGLSRLGLEWKKETLGDLYSFFTKDLPDQIAEIFHRFNSMIGSFQYLPPLREIPKREMDIRSCQLPGWRWIPKNPRLVNSVNRTLESMGIQHRLEVRELVPVTFVGQAILHAITQPENSSSRSEDLLSAAHSAREEWNALKRDDLTSWLERHPALHERFFEKWYREVSRNSEFWGNYYDDYPEYEGGTKPPEWWIREESYRQADTDEWIHPYTEEHDWALALYISEAPEVRRALDATLSEREFKQMTESSVERIEIRLRDEKANAWVSLQDVGVGTSQSLPVILEAYGQSNQLIAIEQPELHLHPALQAELGDIFIESALGENKNTFLLETHSEHLLLRIMRRMRQTFEGTFLEGIPAVRPDDVALLYVSPGADGSVVQEIGLNERGELIKGWPGGFFEEGFNEMFD
jgi:hypothetical protein